MKYFLVFLLGVLIGTLLMLAVIYHASIASLPDVITIPPTVGLWI